MEMTKLDEVGANIGYDIDSITSTVRFKICWRGVGGLVRKNTTVNIIKKIEEQLRDQIRNNIGDIKPKIQTDLKQNL